MEQIMEQIKVLDSLRDDCARQQKKGVHFILASVIIWVAILGVHLTGLPILTKNLLTFCCTAPLMPIAYFFSRVLKIDFRDKGNPLTNLGLLFSLNQIFYLLIAMWAYSAVPEKMMMVIAMIFGAHLLPYSWLYKSKGYLVVAIVVPVLALFLGIGFAPWVTAAFMIAIEIMFSFILVVENKQMSANKKLYQS